MHVVSRSRGWEEGSRVHEVTGSRATDTAGNIGWKKWRTRHRLLSLRLLTPTPLRTPVLEPDLRPSAVSHTGDRRTGTHLDPDFGQVDFEGEFFARVDIGVVGLFEGFLQLVQLKGSESGSVATVFFLVVGVVAAVATLAGGILIVSCCRMTGRGARRRDCQQEERERRDMTGEFCESGGAIVWQK